MKQVNEWLLDCKADVFSQSGEDGIIQKVLNTLPQNDKWCVEFGAWDGRFLSNTHNLIMNHGYSAVLMEGSKERFNDLLKTYAEHRSVVPINQFVGFRAEDNLDHILTQTRIPKDFDFLSIDIDGNDYYVWNAMAEYKPKMVCIEFNPTIPTEVDFVQTADPAINQGCSLLSLVKLGKTKGYELISVLQFNAFFVRSEFFPLFEIADNRPETLRKNLEAVAYIFTGYDGRLFLRGCRNMPWHGLELDEGKIQHLPAFLRVYPGKYTKLHHTMFQLFSDPLALPKKLMRGATKRLLNR